MDINKRNRTELKSFFVKNSIPTESNFRDLMDGMLNQKDDGIAKPEGEPLSIEAAGDANSQQKLINFYQGFKDATHADWTLSLNPRSDPANAATAKRGFSISDGGGTSRLFIENNSGNVGISTIEPATRLHSAVSNTANILRLDSVVSSDFSDVSQGIHLFKKGTNLWGWKIEGSGASDATAVLRIIASQAGVDTVRMSIARNSGNVMISGNVGINHTPIETQHLVIQPIRGNTALNITDPNGSINWLSVFPAGDVIMNGGNVGIGHTTPKRKLHVEGDEIHSGGGKAGFSFANRQTTGLVDSPTNGERWVWYSDTGTARLWSGTDKISITKDGNLSVTGNINKLDVADNFTATVRCADFTMGHSTRRKSPGRALVDSTDTLVVNFGPDWTNVIISGTTVNVPGQVFRGSSRVLKENIIELSEQQASKIFAKLQPLQFNYVADDNKTPHVGFVVEDVPEIIGTPDKTAINTLSLLAVLTGVIKDLQASVAVLEQKLHTSKA